MLEPVHAREPAVQPARRQPVEGVLGALPNEVGQPAVAVHRAGGEPQQFTPRVRLDALRRNLGDGPLAEPRPQVAAGKAARPAEKSLRRRTRVVAHRRQEAVQLALLVDRARGLLHEGRDARV